MEILIWIGAAISVIGLVGLLWCIVLVAKARRENLDDDALRARIQSVVPLNLGALLLSFLGLILVIVGIFLS
jgi:hypothetical protein